MAYCQDNEISWLRWDLNAEEQSFLKFCRTVIQLWHDQPVLKRRKFFLGRRIRQSRRERHCVAGTHRQGTH